MSAAQAIAFLEWARNMAFAAHTRAHEHHAVCRAWSEEDATHRAYDAHRCLMSRAQCIDAVWMCQMADGELIHAQRMLEEAIERNERQ